MPKSLSGLVTGEFDDIETQNVVVTNLLHTKGDLRFSGTNPANFDHLKLGPLDDPVATVLTVDGNVTLTNNNNALIENLVFTGGTTASYDGTHPKTVAIPVMPTLRSLTIVAPNATPQAFVYAPDGGADQTITFAPYPTVTVPTHHFLGVHADEPSTAIVKTYTKQFLPLSNITGLTFTAPSTGAALIEVSFWVEGVAANDFYVALTDDLVNSGTIRKTHVVWAGAGQGQVSTRFRVTGLSGTETFGVFFKGSASGFKIHYSAEKPFQITAQTIP